MITEMINKDLSEILKEFDSYLEILEGKTLLITGGNGFLPSYIVDTIIKYNKLTVKPCKLIIMNKNKITKSSRLSHLIGDKNVTLITQDVGKPFKVPNSDIIIHAASRANPTSFLADPIDTIDANINGLRTLLDYSKDNKIDQFLFFSSFEVYGNPTKEFIPTPETYNGNVNCLNEFACYLEAKRFAETMCMVFFRKYKIPVKLLRILLAYGPGMRSDGKVVSDFFNTAIRKKQINLRDGGEAKRSFCYVSDAIRAIFTVLFMGKSGEAYNIGDDTNNIEIGNLANTIADIVNNKVKINMGEKQKNTYGINNRYPNINKIRELGFSPKIKLEDGLKRLKKHYDEIGFI